MSLPPDVTLRVELDGEGVARVTYADGVESIAMTAPALGRLLTELLKALQGSEPDDYEHEVNLN